MRRRDFLSVIVGATAWPLAARAQQPSMPVVGFLSETGEVGSPPNTAAFGQGLAESGYVEGKNLAIEYRWANFKRELLPQLASDLVRRNVNVIAAITPEAVAVARNATTSIPIVALDLESDPVAKGYVKSLAHPGGNMTGMFLDLPELSGKQIGLLKEIVPRLSRIAIFGIPGLNAAQFVATETAVRALALEAEIMEVRVADDFEHPVVIPTRIRRFEANRRACNSQTAPPYFLVRCVSKIRRSHFLWAERSRDIQKKWRLRRENPARCQAKRVANTAPGEVRSGDQPQDRHGTRR
jgi:ABC transporter substrate binding protein